MDAYLDLSYLSHVFVLFTFPYYFKRIANIRLAKLEYIGLLILGIVLYFNAFVFSEYPYLNLLVILIYFIIVNRRKFMKFYFTYLLAYYGNISIVMLICKDLYLYNTLVFVSKPSACFYFLFELVNIFLVELIMLSIKSIKLYKNYRIKVKIKYKDKYQEFNGYIDSGNTLLVDGVPVIFLKEEFFKDVTSEMLVSGIGKRKCRFFKSLILINNKEKEVICASGNRNGFKGCDCLLNINLMGGI